MGLKLKNLLCFIFIARVMIPMNVKVYDNVIVWSIFHENVYRLCLSNGTDVYVPAMWTIIEEKK